MLAGSGHGMLLSRGGFCVRGKPGGECLRLPSGRALVSYFSVVCPPLLWSVTDYTPALPAAAARQTLNSLLAVLVYVADEHPAIEAGAGTLKASVVRLYSVIVILSRWVRMGCARLCGVHEAPPRGPGPGVSDHLRGHLLIRRHHYTPVCTIILPLKRDLWHNFVSMQRLRRS